MDDVKKATQVTNGKAFEYAIATKLGSILELPIAVSTEFSFIENCFNSIPATKQVKFLRASELALEHIIEKEKSYISEFSPYEIWIASDSIGQGGDVRDVILRGKNSEMGISCKTNHDAFKHPRLSGTIDFVRSWGLLETGCSNDYWKVVKPLFEELRQIRIESDETAKWSEITDVPERFYWPILDAFEAELILITSESNPRASEVTKRLITFLVGNHDFYKVVTRIKSVEIQGFNFQNTLAVTKTKFPEHVIGIDKFDGGKFSKTVRFNRGFTFNFRIHSASSRVEPSLKFDVKAISLPPNEIYTHHIDL